MSEQRQGLPRDPKTLRLAVDGGVLRIVLDRGAVRNAMNRDMIEELLAIVHHLLSVDCLEGDAPIRVVVLRGAGETFCAGGDLRGMLLAAERGEAALQHLNRAFGTLLERLARIPQVLIVGVDGAAMGDGLGLVSVADVAVATTRSIFGTPEVTMGLVPAQIVPFLVRRIGRAQTQRLSLTGGRLSAMQALGLGLVHEVTADSDALEQALAATVSRVQRCAPRAVARTKWLLSRVGDHSMGRVLDDAAEVFARSVLDEAPAGIAAFLEKRSAPWEE